MKIRTKLNFGAIVTGTLLMAFIGVIFLFTLNLQITNKKQQLIEQLVEVAVQSNISQDEYLKSPNEQLKAQWFAVYQKQVGLLDSATLLFSSNEENFLLGDVRTVSVDSKNIFDELVQDITVGNNEKIQDLSSRLAVKEQSWVADSLQLVKLNQAQVTDTQQKFLLFIVVSGFFVLWVYVITFLLATSVVKSLRALEKDFSRISTLDFSSSDTASISGKSNDEIGALRQSFNVMVSKLKKSYMTLDQKNVEFSHKTEEIGKINKAVLNILEDLKNEEAQLVEAKTKDEVLLDSIGDGVIAADNKGKIIVFNRAAKAMLGWEKENFLGKKLYDVLDLYDENNAVVPLKDRPLQIALSTGKPVIAQYQYAKKDGIKFPVAITVTPVILDNTTVGTIELFRDITKAKQIDQMKSEFVSVASHQMRTPLTGIKWLSEILLNSKSNLTAEQVETINQIVVSNTRMIHLVDDLLDVARIDAGQKFEVVLKTGDIMPAIKEVVAELKMVMSAKKVKIILAEDFPKKLILPIDKEKIKLVFHNLLANAIQYANYDYEVKIGFKQDEKVVTFTVADKGIGIPKSQQDQIFQKFFRSDNAKIMQPNGTGLGLYIVKAVIDGHHGKIWFDSELNKGTIFYFSLPLK